MAEKTPIAFGFSKVKAKQEPLKTKVQIQERSHEKQYLETVDTASLAKMEAEAGKKKQLVIPLMPNVEWRTPTPVPPPKDSIAAERQTELETESKGKQQKKGRGHRQNGTTEGGEGKEAKADLTQEAVREILQAAADEQKLSMEKAAPLPILMQNKVPGLDRFTNEDAKFRHDVSLRPDEASNEAYERIPVEDYGVGMLMGMGWKPGDAIGKTNKVAAEPIEFIPRGSRLGLGADPTMVISNKKAKKFIKPGETREEKQQMRVVPSADGRVRHFRNISERLIPVHQLTLRPKVLVEIVGGPHAKLYGRVSEKFDEKSTGAIPVRLNVSQELVHVNRELLEILDEHALPHDHPAFSKKAIIRDNEDEDPLFSSILKKKKKKSRNGDASRSSRSRSRSPKKRDRSSSPKKDKGKKKRKEKEKRKIEPISWIRPHIRVRIISKKLGGGIYYNKKGKVEDVVSQVAFIVVMDQGQLLENINQADVETCIPKVGGRVVVLKGNKKSEGEIGKLIEKNTKKAKATVQLDHDLSFITVSFDYLAEYLG